MCEKCSPFGGLWQETESGLTRCDCAQGQNIRANESRRQNPTRKDPALPNEAATIFAEMLAVIPFYPQEAGARMMVAEEIRCMCASAEEAKWLVTRMARAYRKWPGLDELRRMYCSKHIPLDGMIVDSPSEIYPDGIPSESKGVNVLLEGAAIKQLEAGKIASSGPRTDAATRVLHLASAAKSLTMAGPATAEEIASAPEWLRRLEGIE